MASEPPRGSMSPTRIALLAGVVAVTLIAVGTVVPSFCWSNCKAIDALQIRPTRAGFVVGHYMMVEGTMRSGIDSAGLGGACVAFKTTANQSCLKDVDCKFPSRMIQPDARYTSGYGPRPEFAGAYAYCSPQKTCWIKVHGDHCKKPPPVSS